MYKQYIYIYKKMKDMYLYKSNVNIVNMTCDLQQQ